MSGLRRRLQWLPWRRKTVVDVPIASNEQMELGHHMEPAVVTMFAARTGASICKNSIWYTKIYRKC